MGFSGGGSNVLKSHTHDGTIVQDGGSLNMDNITQGALTAGDLVFSDGIHLQRLAIGTPAQQLQVNPGATAPEYFTPAAAASTWTELLSLRDTAAANTFDTGYYDWGDYRVLKFYWSGYADTGTAPFEVRFYAPDASIITTGVYGTSGFFNSNVLQANGNQTSLDITFGGNIQAGRAITFGMEIQCPANSTYDKATIGSYYLSQRRSYDATFCQGNFYVTGDGWNPPLMICNGLIEISGNTYADCLLTVLGMGDNTT